MKRLHQRRGFRATAPYRPNPVPRTRQLAKPLVVPGFEGDAADADVLGTIVTFLNGIGIATREGPVPGSSFLPGVRVSEGTLLFDRATLRWPGDLLHEAGHLAVAPSGLRPTLNDGVELPPAVPHASEVEATAWAYAAVRHLGLPAEVLFHDGGYRGRSADLVRTYSLGVHPGSFGLAQAGLTHVGPEARERGLPVYPRMSRWLRA